MDDPLGIVSRNDDDLQQAHTLVYADDQEAPPVVSLLLNESDRVADDVKGIRVGDPVFRVVLAGGRGEIHTSTIR